MPSVCPIQVSIPYGVGGALGRAYNEAAARAEEWFLFLDHDLYLVNPWWYQIALGAIAQVGERAGWITCYTNRINNPHQVAPGVDTRSDDLAYHRTFARQLYMRNRGHVLDLTETRGQRFSGFFILSRRSAWERAGGFAEDKGGILHIDVDYYDKVKRAGYRAYLMASLYVYHGYKRDHVKGTDFPHPEEK